MTELSLDQVLDILISAAPGGPYDQAEELLRANKRPDLADALVKLQQDAGVQADPTFDPAEVSNPPGELTAALWQAYEPVTVARFLALRSAVESALNSAIPKPPDLLPG